MDISKFKKKYVEEAEEIISLLEESLLKLENNPDDNEGIEDIFRSMHTLKGGAAMFGYNKIRDITHELETIYEFVKTGEKKLSKNLLDITLEAIDYFKILLDDNTVNEKDQQYHDGLLDRIASVTEEDEESMQSEYNDENKEEELEKEGIIEEEEEEENKEEIHTYNILFIPEKNIIQNGTDPLLLIKELVNLGDSYVYPIINNIPAIENINPYKLYVGWNIVLATANKDEISDVFIFVEEEAKIEINTIDKGNLLQDEDFMKNIKKFLNIENDYNLEDILESSDNETDQEKEEEVSEEIEEKSHDENEESEEIIEDEHELINEEEENYAETAEEKEIVEEGEALDEEKKDRGGKENEIREANKDKESVKKYFAEKNGQKSKKQNSISSIRIPVTKVDELMNLVSELVTTQARLNLFTEKNTNSELEEITENIQKLSSQLRDNAFDLSLIPLQSIVTRFQRMVRDLSSDLGKDIVFKTEGTETELDKSIIENLSDPIMHILRNSIDHGIEDKETRKKLGKPEKGEIKLAAYYSGANVHIQIKDDGKGLDPEFIKKKAVEQDIISKNTQMSNKEIFDLIFLPGFSTSNSVTDLSGRGVGMDVVKEKISEIRGEVELDSKKHAGTTVTIKLPLTLSIIDGILLYIGKTKYIIPLSVVNKIYAIKHKELKDSFYNLVTLSGEQIPYYYLREEFGDTEDTPETEQVVIVFSDNKKFGIVVDKVIGEYQAVLKPLGKHYRKVNIFSGGTILGDGSIALVMDTNKIIKNMSNINIEKEAKNG